jgi:hypothetical protein
VKNESLSLIPLQCPGNASLSARGILTLSAHPQKGLPVAYDNVNRRKQIVLVLFSKTMQAGFFAFSAQIALFSIENEALQAHPPLNENPMTM